MANLIDRNVDERIVRALKSRAGKHSRSAEAEHREIPEAALLKSKAQSFAEVLASIPNLACRARPDPRFESIGLPRVAAVPDRFYAAANFADSDDAEVKRIALGVRVREEAPDAGVCLAAFAYFADNVRVNQVHSGWRHPRFW